MYQIWQWTISYAWTVKRWIAIAREGQLRTSAEAGWLGQLCDLWLGTGGISLYYYAQLHGFLGVPLTNLTNHESRILIKGINLPTPLTLDFRGVGILKHVIYILPDVFFNVNHPKWEFFLNLVCKTLVAKTASLFRDLGSLEDPWNQSWCKLIPTRILYQHVPTLIYIYWKHNPQIVLLKAPFLSKLLLCWLNPYFHKR